MVAVAFGYVFGSIATWLIWIRPLREELRRLRQDESLNP